LIFLNNVIIHKKMNNFPKLLHESTPTPTSIPTPIPTPIPTRNELHLIPRSGYTGVYIIDTLPNVTLTRMQGYTGHYRQR